MNVVIFAAGSEGAGAGHQVRMSTLARHLLQTGHECLLVSVDAPGSSHGWAWRGLPHRMLRDESELLELAAALRPDTVVIDSYSVLPGTLTALASRASVVVIDDVPGRDVSAAALVVNASPDASAADYAVGTRVVSGLGYALVRPEFTSLRDAPPGGPTLVMMGATDARGLLPALLGVLLDATSGRLAVVTGDSRSGPAPAHHDRIDWHHGLGADALAGLMRSCSAGILTASSVCLEAACVGLPFVAIEVADNQARLAGALRRAGVVVLTPEHLGELAASLARAVVPVELRVDGRGAARLTAELERLRTRA